MSIADILPSRRRFLDKGLDSSVVQDPSLRVTINRINGDIGCLDIDRLPATLIANNGYHCQVWQRSSMVTYSDGATIEDIVIKKPRGPGDRREARLLKRDYDVLRERLGDMIPEAVFIVTQVDGEENVIAIAETVHRWFNIANPINLDDAVPLLRRLEHARQQLARFLLAARQWREQDGRIIDLYGQDNLVLARDRSLRYIDSFRVFFYEDLLHLIDGVDEDLKAKIEISLHRRDYLEFLLREASIACIY